MAATLGTPVVRPHRANAPSGAPSANGASDGASYRRLAAPGSLASTESHPLTREPAMRIRSVTFGLTIPVEAYAAHAIEIAPAFTAWTDLLAKWWLADTASGSFGGVYLFASQHDADRSRETDVFRGMFTNPALKD